MLKTLALLGVISGGLLTAGCLQKETSHTLYLSPDGAVSWVAAESSVHSDETEIGRRIAEEQPYITDALVGAHGVARGLRALGPLGNVRTTVVRDERPFHVITEARFARIDRVLERVFREMKIRATASLIHGTHDTTVRVRLDFSRPLDEKDTAISELDGIEHMRFVLTEGRFGAVSGFEVQDGFSARLSNEWLDRAEQAYEAKGTIELELAWTTEQR